jgi:hypothetical protein
MDSSPKINPAALILDSLRGAALTSLETPTGGMWQFHFGSATLLIECPWRAVRKGVIALGADDNGQKFGLPEPVSVLQEFPKLVRNMVVTDVRVDNETADLSVHFGDELRLDAFNDSSGYEGWNYTDTKGVTVIATGGGELAIWAKAPTRSEG